MVGRLLLHTADLQCEQSHGGQPHPGVQAVEVRDGGPLVVRAPPVAVEVQHRQEAHRHARDGQDVEHRVQQLVPQAAAAAARAVDQHGCEEV